MDLLTVEHASAMLGVAAPTLRYWRSVNEGPPSFKIGRRVVYRRAELEAWIAAQEATSRRGGAA